MHRLSIQPATGPPVERMPGGSLLLLLTVFSMSFRILPPTSPVICVFLPQHLYLEI
jgi:hypothetical protein